MGNIIHENVCSKPQYTSSQPLKKDIELTFSGLDKAYGLDGIRLLVIAAEVATKMKCSVTDPFKPDANQPISVVP